MRIDAVGPHLFHQHLRSFEIVYISLEHFNKNIAHGWFHRYASTFEIQLMPTLSVVPLVLTLPNFLATQVASQSFLSFIFFRWRRGPTPTTAQTSPCTFFRWVERDQRQSISEFGLSFSTFSFRHSSVNYLDLSKSTKVTSHMKIYVQIYFSLVEQPWTCSRRAAIQAQLLVLWGHIEGNQNMGPY